MFRSKLIASVALGALVLCAGAGAATPGNLDELLEQTRTARQREAQANQER